MGRHKKLVCECGRVRTESGGRLVCVPCKGEQNNKRRNKNKKKGNCRLCFEPMTEDQELTTHGLSHQSCADELRETEERLRAEKGNLCVSGDDKPIASHSKKYCQDCLDDMKVDYAFKVAAGMCGARGCGEMQEEGRVWCKHHIDISNKVSMTERP